MSPHCAHYWRYRDKGCSKESRTVRQIVASLQELFGRRPGRAGRPDEGQDGTAVGETRQGSEQFLVDGEGHLWDCF